MSVRRAFIQNHDILGHLGAASQEALAASSRLVQLEDGQFVFRQGDEGQSFFAICRGSIRVYRQGPDGREAVVKILQPGEIFGEVVIFQDVPYPANARCLEDCSLIQVDKPVLLELLGEARFRLDFIATLLEKLHYLSKRVYFLSALDVEERFFRYLIDEYGESGEYDMDLSKKDLASAIGTVPETLSRLIQRLRSRGLISWEGRHLSVHPGVLADFAARDGE